MGLKDDLVDMLVASQNLKQFLALIRVGEGTSDPDGYRRMFGGELFTSFADHPRKAITKPLGGKPTTSTAAGAYQFLSRTWDECQKALDLPDFSASSQDIAAVYLIRRRGALPDALAGRWEAAIRGSVITLMILAGWNGVKDFWMGSSDGSQRKTAEIMRMKDK